MTYSDIFSEPVGKVVINDLPLKLHTKLRPSHGDIRLEPMFDETRDRYALMQIGCDQGRRVRGNLIYLTTGALRSKQSRLKQRRNSR